jgi:hypothetical protein
VRLVLTECGFGDRAEALIRAVQDVWDAPNVSALCALLGDRSNRAASGGAAEPMGSAGGMSG